MNVYTYMCALICGGLGWKGEPRENGKKGKEEKGKGLENRKQVNTVMETYR